MIGTATSCMKKKKADQAGKHFPVSGKKSGNIRYFPYDPRLVQNLHTIRNTTQAVQTSRGISCAILWKKQNSEENIIIIIIILYKD